MKILSIGSDRKIFEEKSAVRARQIEYGNLFEEVHIIVFNKKSLDPGLFKDQQISPNVWLYGTYSASRFFYIFDAIRIGRQIIRKRNLKASDTILSAQDPFEAGFVGWRIARKFSMNLHLQIHTDFLSPYFTRNSLLNKIRVPLAKFLLLKASSVRAVSSKIKKTVVEQVGISENKVDVLPIYIDIEKIKNSIPSADLHKKYPQFDLIMLVVSRLEPEKNISMAVRAFGKIIAKYPKTGLVIVGSGSEIGVLKQEVLKNKLTKSVAFESWTNDPISYFKTADLFLLTSNFEGYGLTLAEAALSGCPILSTEVGIAPDLFAVKGCLLCPVGDEQCFIEKMSAFLDTGKTVRQEAGESDLEGIVYNRANYVQKFKENLTKTLSN